MLTYLQVHWYFTLPPTIVLYLLLRPLITRFDRIKILILCILSVAYTTPWDNYIIYHKAWWYRKDAVIGTIGYVPIEEYMFFVIQTVFTSLWTILCSRWTLNSLNLRRSTRNFNLQPIKYVGMGVMVLAILFGWFNAKPATKLFYLCSIMWWTLLVMTLLWYIGSSYVVHSYKQILFSIVCPSVYLCYVDVIALRANVWHINERTSLEIFVVPDLPLEEVIFFFVTNCMVVLGAACFDKAKAVIDTYHREPLQMNSKFNFRMGLSAAFTTTQEENSQVIDDLETCLEILKEGSKTFSLAAKCFPNGKYAIASNTRSNISTTQLRH